MSICFYILSKKEQNLRVPSGGRDLLLSFFYKDALDLEPNYAPVLLRLGQAYIATGRFEDAIRSLKIGSQLWEYNSIDVALLGAAYARAGQLEEARREFENVQQLAQQKFVSAIAFAYIYFAFGEIETGFDWLEKAADEHHSFILHALVCPIYDSLRSHPRYLALLRKMDLGSR